MNDISIKKGDFVLSHLLTGKVIFGLVVKEYDGNYPAYAVYWLYNEHLTYGLDEVESLGAVTVMLARNDFLKWCKDNNI